MSYNVGALGPYTDEMSFSLISKAVLSTNLMEHSTLRSGLRSGTTAINILDANIAVSPRDCSWVDAGDMVYTQVDIVMEENQTKQSLCPTLLRDVYLSEKLSASAHSEDVPFEEVVSELFVQKIKNYNEFFLANKLFTAVTVANGAANSGQTTASDIDSIIDDVQDLCAAVDPSVLDRNDLTVVMSNAQYNLLRRALVAANLFHYTPSDNNSELMIPGTDFKAIKGTFTYSGETPISADAMVAGSMGDFIIGVGLEDDFDTLKIFYSQDNDEVRVMSAWRLGAAVVDVTKWAKNGTL